MTQPISRLTKDLLALHVFPNLNGKDLLACLRVCKLWNQAASDEKLWKELCHRDFLLAENPTTWKKEFLATISFSNLFQNSEPQKYTLKGHSSEIRSIELDNGILASVDGDLMKPSTICIWNLETKTCLSKLQDSSVDTSFSIRGDRIAFLARKGRQSYIHFWNWRVKESEDFTIGAHNVVPILLKGDLVSWVKIEPSSRIGSLLKWDTEEIVMSQMTNQNMFWLIGDFLIASASGLGNYIITVSNWRTNQSSLAILSGHTDDVESSTLEGNILASGSHDGTVRVWDWTQQQCLLTIVGASCIGKFYTLCDFNKVSVALNGPLVAFAVPSPTLQIWNWHTQQHLLTFEETSGLNVLFYENKVISSHKDDIHIWAYGEEKGWIENLIQCVKNFYSTLAPISKI